MVDGEDFDDIPTDAIGDHITAVPKGDEQFAAIVQGVFGDTAGLGEVPEQIYSFTNRDDSPVGGAQASRTQKTMQPAEVSESLMGPFEMRAVPPQWCGSGIGGSSPRSNPSIQVSASSCVR